MLIIKKILPIIILILQFFDIAIGQQINPKTSLFKNFPFERVSSYADECFIYYDKTNEKIYFVRKYHEQNVGGKNDSGDIWYVKKNKDNNWGVVTNMGKSINDKNENVIIGVSGKGNIIWLYGRYDDEAKLKRKNYIYKYNLTNKEFKRQKIKYYHNTSKSPSFFVNEEGSVMILSINTFDSKGVEDLYISFLEPENSKHHWSVPKNLGEGINTIYQEKTPYLSSDNISLMFSSNGHPGNGSLDVYLSQRKDSGWKNWSKPFHLNDNINTIGVDNHFILLGSGEGLYSSTYDSYGYGDIKWVNWKKGKINVKPIVSDSVSKIKKTVLKPKIEKNVDSDDLEIKGEIYDSNTNEMLSAEIIVSMVNEHGVSKKLNFKTIKKGVLYVEFSNLKLIRQNNEFITLKISAEGYLSKIKRIKLSSNTISVNYKIDKLVKGATIQLKNVLFQSGTSQLLNESKQEIEQVAEAMKLNKNMTIELRGHTDGKDNEFNVRLSQNRVALVKKVLVGNGINHTRIIGKGFGSKKPLYNNEDKINRKLNRRVEFKILNL